MRIAARMFLITSSVLWSCRAWGDDRIRKSWRSLLHSSGFENLNSTLEGASLTVPVSCTRSWWSPSQTISSHDVVPNARVVFIILCPCVLIIRQLPLEPARLHTPRLEYQKIILWEELGVSVRRSANGTPRMWRTAFIMVMVWVLSALACVSTHKAEQAWITSDRKPLCGR